ncbi:MAG: YfhO family protein, partial [Pedobacter sp.]|nr:YfhO family protein [Pedobacter sp.]
VVLAVMVNASLLWTTSEYAKETNRGKSNLTTSTPDRAREYAYGWSQGVGESFTFFISDLYGGSHEKRLDDKSNVFKTLVERGVPQDQAMNITQQMPTYWGEKTYTSGGYYFGALVCFLYVFGLFIVRSRLKWWILSTTVLFMLLSFGKNFPFVSDLFFNYFPLYSKFRAVESILAVVGLMVPILAFLAVKEIQETKIDRKLLIKKLGWSAAIIGGFSLIVALAPTLFFGFKTSTHQDFLQQLTQAFGDGSFAQQVANALVQDRISIARADALRSVVFVIIGFVIIWAFINQKLKPQLAFGLLAVAVLIDMWQVDRRYLNNDRFVSPSEMAKDVQPREVDAFINADKDPNFRVFDQPNFGRADGSRFHKTIGGYHAAKLKRYDELIEHQLSQSVNQDVLDMLNTKYFITQDPQNGSYKMTRNPTALGNAWLVKGVQFAKDADEEMKAISSFDPKLEAIVDEQYKNMIDTTRLGADPSAFIKMEKYHPDHIEYSYSAPRDVIAVFSEIYYNKGWNMYIDGVEKPYFRANYVLRAAQLPMGNHKVEFKFEPKSYYLGEKISLAGSILLLGFLGFAGYTENRKKKTA